MRILGRSSNSTLKSSALAAAPARLSTLDATQQSDSQGIAVPQLVAAQALVTPNKTAVAAGGQVITYADLEFQANRIARHLRSLGVGREVLVGLCLPRSVAQVTAALGVAKAGAAYVPLDPAYPPERISWMLNDARPALLITQERIAERLSGRFRTVDLDRDRQQIASHSGDPIDSDAASEDLAYVIYTSGSTGRPKGVQITHGALLNLVLWHHRAFGVTHVDRASLLASPAFDAAVWELWPYLTTGASLHLPDDAIRSEPEALRNWLVAEKITITFVPTPLAERMITLKWPRGTALRIMLTGADTLHRYPPSNLPFTLVNNYGPTECTVVATSGTVPQDGGSNGLPDIGVPISNVQIHILDEYLKPVPQGTAGEIYIGGSGVARGYLNAPDLTAAHFIANPYDSESTGRLYKTGDLGRYLPNGHIAFMGRVDDQIKIRGYRIEPNEIVTVLAKHPMISESVVVAREDNPGDKRLVAYVVPIQGTRPTDQVLKEFLRGQLPEYMIPMMFVRVDALPLNASGKIDRAALPVPDDANSLHVEDGVAPHSPVEQRVAELIAPLLGVTKVGIDDNFFLLGGHSLLGTQLIACIRKAFGVELSLRSLFEHPTVAALAAEVEHLLYVRLESMSESEAEHAVRAHKEAGIPQPSLRSSAAGE